jgi:hypothetical protein
MFGVITPLSAIFQLYHGEQVLVMEEAGENHRPWENNWSTLSLAAASRVHLFFLIYKVRCEPTPYW